MRHGRRSVSAPRGRWVALLLALGAAGLGALGPLAAQSAPAAPDPFYLSLLQEGIQLFEEGDAAGAAKSLRLACFGLLEDPRALGGCLVRLGLAQATAGDRDAFFETSRRLFAVEQRFAVYRSAELPPDVRARFEDWLVRLVPEQQLASVEAFSALAQRRLEVRIRRMPPREREKDLLARLAEEPADPRWILLLAELEVEEGKAAAALARAEAVLAAAPGNGAARCVRGLARAEGGACPGAVEDLFPCPRSRSEPAFAQALLACQVALSQWAGARDLLAALPAEVREDREVARLAQRVAREGPSNAAPAPPAEVEAAAPDPPPSEAPRPDSQRAEPSRTDSQRPDSQRRTPPPTAAAPPASANRSAPARPDLPVADRDKLERARQLAAGIQHAGQLAEPLRLAIEVAEANPASAEAQHLAGLLAYRASRWQEAVTYFRRGGDPGDDRPVLLFYLAVSSYETGDRAAAAAALERALPRLEKTPLVESYRRKILGDGLAPG